MQIPTLRAFLIEWQFWLLEALFAGLVATTMVEVRRLAVRRASVVAGCALAIGAWLLTATVPPRTSRIYYDEQIYQGIGRNLSDLHRAQMCNDGTVEYGRLQCAFGEYNKEPYGFPYVLSLLYRIGGVSDTAAFRLNNVVAAVAVLVTVLLADVLFASTPVAVVSGLVLALLPMQLHWSNTAAAEPIAACLCALAVLAAVHFARARTTSALAWTIASAAFATTARPECLLLLPIVAAAILLLAPGEFRTRRLWLGGLAGLAACAVSLLHIAAVRVEGWGTTGPQMSWRFAEANVRTNFPFFFADERFPALCGIAAVVGIFSVGALRERALVLLYFLAFWTVFVFFYAGSYNYGADVRYSLMTNVPVAILAAAGLTRAADGVRALLRRSWSDAHLTVAIVVVIVVQFLWYVPLVRATGEEAWAARADVAYAKRFASRLPPDSLVLTHNPAMFHVWNVNAAQMSLVKTDPHLADRLFSRYAGGVYLHWNFWCNVPDPVQNAFCRAALDTFPHELVESARERDYQYALYRLTAPEGLKRR